MFHALPVSVSVRPTYSRVLGKNFENFRCSWAFSYTIQYAKVHLGQDFLIVHSAVLLCSILLLPPFHLRFTACTLVYYFELCLMSPYTIQYFTSADALNISYFLQSFSCFCTLQTVVQSERERRPHSSLWYHCAIVFDLRECTAHTDILWPVWSKTIY